MCINLRLAPLTYVLGYYVVKFLEKPCIRQFKVNNLIQCEHNRANQWHCLFVCFANAPSLSLQCFQHI